MIDFIIPVVIGIILGVMILHAINLYRNLSSLSEEFDKMDEFVDNVIKQKFIILEVEAVDGQFLCYNRLTKEFVCMGRNMEEVQERFQQRYPGKEAGMVKEDPVAQQLKEAT